MNRKLSFLKILFLFLGVCFLESCEPSDINEETQNIEEDEWNIQAIERPEVEDPGDRGNKG